MKYLNILLLVVVSFYSSYSQNTVQTYTINRQVCVNADSYYPMSDSDEDVDLVKKPISFCFDTINNIISVTGYFVRNGEICFKYQKDKMEFSNSTYPIYINGWNLPFSEINNGVLKTYEYRYYQISFYINKQGKGGALLSKVTDGGKGFTTGGEFKLDTLCAFESNSFKSVPNCKKNITNNSKSNNSTNNNTGNKSEINCDSNSNWYNSETGKGCYNGRKLYTGSKGGIFYLLEDGSKVYVTKEVRLWK